MLQRYKKILEYANYLDKSVVKLHFYLDKSVVKLHFYLDKSVICIFTDRGYFYKYFTFGSRLIVPVFFIILFNTEDKLAQKVFNKKDNL